MAKVLNDPRPRVVRVPKGWIVRDYNEDLSFYPDDSIRLIKYDRQGNLMTIYSAPPVEPHAFIVNLGEYAIISGMDNPSSSAAFGIVFTKERMAEMGR